jgi:hypothetical protein
MSALPLAGFLVFGFAVGVLHFALLRWNTTLFLRRGALLAAFALMALRLVTTGGALFLAVLHGALPLLFAAFGVVLARPLVRRVMA